jgi:hypothetical protein
MEVKRFLRFLILGFLLFILLLFPSQTVADGPPRPVQFADEETLTLTWSENIEFVVLNNTTKDITVTIGIGGFEPAAGDKVLEAGDLLLPYDSTIEIVDSGSEPVVIPVDANKRPAPDIYTAMLVVSERTKDVVIRKPIQITVRDEEAPPPKTPPTPLNPGVSALTITAYRVLPFVKPWCPLGCNVPVEDDSGAVNVKPGHLAYLGGENGGALGVSVAGYSADRGATLGLDFADDWGRVGKYEGDVDFLPDDEEDEEAGKVTLTVNVKDIILWPIIFLLAGIYLAIWTEHWVGVRRKLWALISRQGMVESVFNKQDDPIAGYSIKRDLIGTQEGKGRLDKLLERLKALDKTAFQTFTENLKTAFRARKEEEKASEEEKNEYEKVVEELELIEEAVEAWGDFGEQLKGLKEALDTKAKPAIDEAKKEGRRPSDWVFPYPPHDKPELYEFPQFYTVALSLLEGEPLTLEEFKELREKIKKVKKLAESWGDLEKTVWWIRERMADLKQLHDKMTPAEQKLLDGAYQDANSAWVDLWLATDDADLEERGAKAELASAQDAVRRLYHVRRPPAPPAPEWRKEEKEKLYLPSPLEVTELPEEPEKRALYARQALLLGDGALVVIGTAIALVTGLTELYFTENFGTFANYLAALIWGAGTQASVTVLNTALGRLFGQRG